MSALPFDIVTAEDFLAKDVPELAQVIPGILTEGLSMLAGKPKGGKSWLVRQWAYAVATGGQVWGTEVEPSTVLFLALEDGEAALHEKLSKLGPMPCTLHIARQWKRMDRGGADDLRTYLKQVPECKLIVIDSLYCVRKPARASGNAYDEEAENMLPFKQIADDHPGLALLVVHHLRKSAGDDEVDEFSGTSATAGKADNLLTLKRANEGQDAALHVWGRTLPEGTHPLRFDGARCIWERISGDVFNDRECSQMQQAVLRVLREAGAPMRNKDVAAAVLMPENKTGNTLLQLKKQRKVERLARGLWQLSGAPSGDYGGGSTYKEIDELHETGTLDHGGEVKPQWAVAQAPEGAAISSFSPVSAPPRAPGERVDEGGEGPNTVTLTDQATTGTAGESNDCNMSDWARRLHAFEAAIAPLRLFPRDAKYILGLEDYPAVEDVAEAVVPLFKARYGERFNAVCAEMGVEPDDAACQLRIEDDVNYDDSYRGVWDELEGWNDNRVDEDTAIALLRAKPQPWNCPRVADLPF